MNTTKEDVFREYAWNYFELHAQQRLQAFEFFITLATATLAGFVTLIQVGQSHKWLSIIGFGLSFISFVFWKLEVRTRALVKNAEAALNYLDAQHGLADIEGVPHPLRMFARDEHFTKQTSKWPLVSGHLSYARCFRWVFIAFALLGLILAGWSLAVF